MNLYVLIRVFQSTHANRIAIATVSSSKYPIMEYKTFACNFKESIWWKM